MLPAGADFAAAVEIKREVVVALAPYASAVLLDSTYGLASAMHMSGKAGLLMALEKSGYSGDSTYRKIDFQDGWTVAQIKQMGASAVKLLAYYHPDSGALAEEIEGVVKAVVDECHRHDLPLFLEPVSYSLDTNVKKESEAFATTRPDVVRETARRLSRLGADVMKLEFPYDAAFNNTHSEWQAACEAVSAVCEAPWVLLSAGVDFSTFEHQTRIACSAGASGFLAGRAIWKEGIPMSPEARREFLANTALDRIKRLADAAGQYARPWTDFYAPMASTEDWLNQYALA
jgi:tagatose-1,6-bisphosphate aldolase